MIRSEHFDVARFESSDSGTDDLIGLCRWMHVAEERSASMKSIFAHEYQSTRYHIQRD
jgi:hypothetical protein